MSGTGTVMDQAEYLKMSYDPSKVPFGVYPGQLSKYISDRFFPKPGSVLDAGCGRGEFMAGFAALGHEVSGVDVSPAAPDFAPELDIRVAALGANTIPFEPSSFDYVFSKSVVEHLRDPVDFLAGAYACLKPGGVAVIMTPSWMHTAWGPFYMDHTHVTPFTIPSLNQAMELAGFKNVKGEHFYQLPSIWKYPAVSLVSKVVAALPIPYRPFYPDAKWPDRFNKFVRFSNELMLLSVGTK